jgi:glycosyltransferase involved in cell wall biosynthesis
MHVGRFVSDAVEQIQSRGIEVDVVRPGVYRDYGLTYGPGVVANVRRRPWRAPMMLLSMIMTLRRRARDADLVHVHWLAGAFVGRFARRPLVVTLHGTGTAGARFEDKRLAATHPRFVRWLLRPADAVICVSEPLANQLRLIGVRNVHTIPSGVAIPDVPALLRQPPPLTLPSSFVLFAGRLSPEKGIENLVAATEGMNLVVAGDGPLREQVPQALGMLGYDQLQHLYVRASALVLASYREGLPVAIIEAMAHGCPVVATRVGGIPSLIEDGVDGLLVDPGDVPGLRTALERVLGNPDLASRLGSAGRKRVERTCAWETVTARTLELYTDVENRR